MTMGRKRNMRLGISAGSSIAVNILVVLLLPLLNRVSSGKVQEFVEVRPMVFVPPVSDYSEKKERLVTPPKTHYITKSEPLPIPDIPSPAIPLTREMSDVLKRTKVQYALQKPVYDIQEMSIDLSAAPPQNSSASEVSSISSNTPFGVNELDVPVNVLRKVQPAYPYVAKRLGVEGRFLVRFIVHVDGRIGDLQIVSKPEGAGTLFDKGIEQAFKQWRFTPGKKAGVDVPSWEEVPVIFELD